MKVVIFGLGYVGCTAAACIASEGHHVVGIDVSEKKVADIQAGICPIEEPGLGELIAKARHDDLLSAQQSIGDSLSDADLAIVCVGTPSGPDGAHDMRYIFGVTNDIAQALANGPDRKSPLTVAYRSTMRSGTIDKLIMPILNAKLAERTTNLVELVYNPEFLRESSAIKDYREPPKIVVGTHDGNANATMDALHSNIDAAVFNVPFAVAEMCKFVDNSWHAVKVGFANEIGRIAAQQSIDPQAVHQIFAADTKLNLSAYYTRPGGPFGGSCLPKDVRALQYISAELGANTPLLDSVLRTNAAHKHFQFEQVSALLPEKATVLIAGLAFKALTDDLRESPNVDLARKLLENGHIVHIYDPAVSADHLVGQNLGYAYTNLPSLRNLLVNAETANSTHYDLAVKTNRTFDQLSLSGAGITIDLDSMR